MALVVLETIVVVRLTCLRDPWRRHLMLRIVLVVLVSLISSAILLLWTCSDNLRGSSRYWRTPRLLDWRGRTASTAAVLLHRCGFLLTLPALSTRRCISALELLESSFQVDNGLVEFSKVAANIGVDRDDVPRCDDQIVEVWKGGLNDVIEEIHLDLRRYGVEGLAFDVFRDRLQPDPLALV
jgi:hypothetical protein